MLLSVLPLPKPGLRGLPYRLIRPIAKFVLRLNQCNAHQTRIERRVDKGETTPGRGYVQDFKLKLVVDPDDRERIPKEGPLIVTSNHPFGAHDALSLIALLESRRSDVKLLANDIMSRMNFLKENLILVDVFGDEGETNSRAMREAARHVRNGGALIVM